MIKTLCHLGRYKVWLNFSRDSGILFLFSTGFFEYLPFWHLSVIVGARGYCAAFVVEIAKKEVKNG